MQKIVTDCLPQWWKTIDKEKDFLILTNDIDSYLSCLYLKKKFGVEIGGFYDFKNVYINDEVIKGKSPIYVDADVVKKKAFGNHPTSIKNKDSVNLNCNINESNYFKKYAGSTLFMLFSLYEEDLTKINKELVKLLLTVDGWLTQYNKYKQQWSYWVEIMEMEYLNDILENIDVSSYYSMTKKYNMTAPISIKDDYTLNFNLNYEEIYEDFGLLIPKLDIQFDKKYLNLKTYYCNSNKMLEIMNSVFSNAMTSRYSSSFSYK